MAVGEGKIVSRYAKAIFEVEDSSRYEEVRGALNALAETWKGSVDLQAALANPRVPFSERMDVVTAIVDKVHPGNPSVLNLIKLLLENGRLGLLEQIAKAFSDAVDAFEKRLSIEITSAVELDEEERAELTKDIEKSIGASPRITWEVDSEIIGGLLVNCGDRLLDGSIRGSLDRVRTELVG